MAGLWTRALGAAALLCASGTDAGSLYWGESTSGNFDHGRQLDLPANFGNSDFTLELWIRPDNNFPVGSPTANQLQNWSNEDLTPYSSSGWWFHGNFLLDGHNNAGSNFQNGTFSLQIYGGGRVRWLFGDGTSGGLQGNLWAVQSSSSPNVLDGAWHHVALVRRCTATGSPATLELWVDGAMHASETTTQCPNMATGFWNNWTGFPNDQRGWYWGAEKQAANGSAIWEDYKGLVDEIRFWTTDRLSAQLGAGRTNPVNGNEANLAGWYDFNEGSGTSTCRFGSTTDCITLTNTIALNVWSSIEAPTTGAGGDTTPPSIPQNLVATPTSATTVMLGWSASTDNVGGSGVASYTIRRDGSIAGSSAGTSYNDFTAVQNTTYSYTVSATDAAGNQSGQSAAASATTPVAPPDTIAPSAPTNFAASATSSSNISLTWTASTDNVGVTGYEVRRGGTLIGSPTGTSFNDNGLAASTTYSYTILAVDAAGNTSATASASATTRAASSSSSSGGGGGGGGGRFDILTLFVALTLLAIQVQRRKRPTVLDRAA